MDSERARMWHDLQRLAEAGPGQVHRWSHVDGLPHPASSPAHQHAVPTVAICLNGVVRILGRKPLDLRQGESLVIEPGCWHDHVEHRRGCTSFGMGQLGERSDVLFFGYRLGLWGWVPQQPYAGILGRLMETEGQDERRSLVRSLLAQVAVDRVHCIEFDDDSVLAMAAHLWNNLHRPLDAGAITARAGSGRTKAFKAFKAFFTRTPKQELLHERVQMARHLLQRGLTPQQVAERCGFSSRSDLTRAYGRAFGKPPSRRAESG